MMLTKNPPLPTGPSRAPLSSQETLWVILAALMACVAKLFCAWTTIGTNDVTSFYHFAKVIDLGGLKAAYELGPVFNHPPLVAGFLLVIWQIAETGVVAFPFLLRLPSILADLAVVLVLLRFTAGRPKLRLPFGLWLVFALSPVSFMVSGFHGNTDPIMVLWLVLAAVMCSKDSPTAAGLFLAFSLHTKAAALIVAPVYFFFWWARGRAFRFSLTCGLVLLVGWIEPLMTCPALALKNVLGYSSYWGIWGITYWLMMMNIPAFQSISFTNLSAEQTAVVTALKLIIMGTILLLAWRRRKLSDGIFTTVALAWSLFFALSPGVGSQYLVWPACFLLFSSWRWFMVVMATSTLFQFFFYNAINGGMPWFYGNSSAAASPLWRPWTVWPWLAFSLGLIWYWKRSGSPKLFSLETVEPDNVSAETKKTRSQAQEGV